MKQFLAAQQKHFAENQPKSYEARIATLKRLEAMILKNQQAFIDAVSQDFGRRAVKETQFLELVPVLSEIRHSCKHLKQWMKPKSVAVDWYFQPACAKIMYQPLGVVGIMGAWNYPISLTLTPLVNALAAGNCAIIKPSEIAPATSHLLATLIAQTFAPEEVTVLEGGADVAAAFSALPFDHLIFTGSARIGRKVMAAAVDNLTPVTLELGGKSPVIVHESYPLADAADKIITSKLWNGGQTCIAPDYVLVHESERDAFVQSIQKALATRFDKVVENPHYTHMINPAAWERMHELVQQALQDGAQAIVFNPVNEVVDVTKGAFLPTILLNVNDDMRVMQEEIFGPILPIMTYSSLDAAIEYINQHDRPLAFYYFDRDKTRATKVLQQIHAGNVSINDCMLQYAQSNLPFGGIGSSGMGAYHGHTGFLTFSKQTGVFIQSRLVTRVFGFLVRVPYSRWTDRLLGLLMRRN